MGNSSSSSSSTPKPLNFENRRRHVHFEGQHNAPSEQHQDDQTPRDTPKEQANGLPPLSNDSMFSTASPSFLRQLERRFTPCNQIMTPDGIWYSSKTPSQASVSVLAQTIGDDTEENEAMLHVTKKFDGGKIDIRTNTAASLNAAASVKLNPWTTLGGAIDTSGIGRVGCDTRTYLGDEGQGLLLGSWCEFNSSPSFSSLADTKVTTVGGHAVALQPRSIVAIEAIAPTDTLNPAFSYHFSADISEAGASPLILSMHKSPDKASISVAKLRNDQSNQWTLAMTKKADESKAELKAGLFCPLNDHIGAKVVATPSNFQGAICFRSDCEPKATCSFIFGVDAHKAAVTGIALELNS